MLTHEERIDRGIAGGIRPHRRVDYRDAGAGARAGCRRARAGACASAAILDETKVKALKSVAERQPPNAQPRAELANLYFDAER